MASAYHNWFPLIGEARLGVGHAFRIPTPLGLSCGSSTTGTDCAGFLASDVDRTVLDVTVRIPAPPATPPYPLVVNLHGYGGSKTSKSSWDDQMVGRGYAVLRYSARGFGKSWGQVNLADLGVELSDLRSMIGQVADDARLQLDPDAVAVLGASYGGWMINWMWCSTARTRC